MLTIYGPRDYSREDPRYLTEYTDLCIEHKLVMDERALSFDTSVSNVKAFYIQTDGYIRYDSVDYVIREVTMESSGKASVFAQMDIEKLEWRAWKKFSYLNGTVRTAAILALNNTGWTVNDTSSSTLITSAALEYVNSYDILKELSAIYQVNFKFNTIGKVVTIAPVTKVDTGAYVSDELNLKNITIKRTSYDTFTELEAYGNNDLTFASINDGKNYITSYGFDRYAKKKRYLWSAPEYTDAGSLLAASRIKLAEMSKPLVTIDVDAFDISKVNPNYPFNSLELGKIVTIIDAHTGTFEKEIVTEKKEYPDDPLKNSYVFANKMITLTDLLGKTAGNVSNVPTVKEDYSLFDSGGSSSGGSGSGDIFDDGRS